MKPTHVLLGALHLFSVNSVAAAPNQDHQANHELVTSLLLEAQQPLYPPEQLFNDRTKDESDEIDKEARNAIRYLDSNRVCEDVSNVTIEAPQGNVTFSGSYLLATHDRPPTTWVIRRDERNNNEFQMKVQDPAERQLYWQGGSGRVRVGSSNYYRFKIKMAPQGRGAAILYSSSGCLYFYDNGEGHIGSDTACTVVKIRKINQVVEWEDQSINSDQCSVNVLKKIQDETEAKVRQLLLILKANTQGGEIDMKGVWSDIGNGIKKTATWAWNKSKDLLGGAEAYSSWVR